MRKTLALILAALMLLSIIPVVFAVDTANTSISVSLDARLDNNSVLVDINITDSSDVKSGALTISYPETLVEYAGFAVSPLIEDFQYETNTTVAGELQFAFAGNVAVSGGTLATIAFTPLGYGTVDFGITIDELIASDTTTHLETNATAIGDTIQLSAPASISFSSNARRMGNTLFIDVAISENSGVRSGEFILVFPANLVEYVGCQTGPMLTDFQYEHNNTPYGIEFAFAGVDILTEAGTVATFEFNILAAGTADFTLTLTELLADDTTTSLLDSADALGCSFVIEEIADIIFSSSARREEDKLFVDVSISENSGVRSGILVLGFPTDLVEYTAYQVGTLIEDFQHEYTATQTGTVEFAFAGVEALTAAGTIVTFEFDILDAGNADFTLTLTELLAEDTLTSLLDSAEAVGCTFVIEETIVTTEPPTTEPPTTEPPTTEPPTTEPPTTEPPTTEPPTTEPPTTEPPTTEPPTTEPPTTEPPTTEPPTTEPPTTEPPTTEPPTTEPPTTEPPTTEPPVVTYTVTFEDWDGTVLKTEEVEEGEDATPPEDPTRNYWVFTGWDGDYTNVTSDITVTATYLMVGDVNIDNRVNTGDAALTLRHSVGLAELNELQLEIADINYDSRVDTGDAAMILRIAVGIITIPW